MAAIVLGVAVAGALGTGTAVVLRRIGERRDMAIFLGVITAILCAAVELVTVFVAFGECLAENPDPPPPSSYPWSPRRQYCNEGSAESIGGLALILVPAIGIVLGTVFRRREWLVPAFLAYALVPLAPFVPNLYLEALPYDRIEDTEVFYDPVLRPASGETGPRVCMRYGLAYGEAARQPEDPFAERTCVDLEPTEEARRLTDEYDQGRTPGALDNLADDLSQRGAEVEEGETAVPGIVISDVYRMTLGEAGVRKVDANGIAVPYDDEVLASRPRIVRRASRVAAAMEACGRARKGYVGCDEILYRRMWRPRDRYSVPELEVGILVSPEFPRQYSISVSGLGGRAEVIRPPGAPRNAPPVFRCFDQQPCPIADSAG